jgi:transcriptional regulator with XRE-family HTH domain
VLVAIQLTTAQRRFSKALRELAGSTQREVAELAGVHESTLSRLLTGTRPLNFDRLATDICRGGLMVKAALLGREDAELMKYTEHAIFGLPRVAAEVAVPEARERAEQIRRAKAEMRRAS